MTALTSPAALRNREPILAVLQKAFPHTGIVLEIASGTGEHAAYFAAALPGVTWQPTDIDEASLRSIEAHGANVPNLLPPIGLDVTREPWPVARADAMLCCNMIHIAPWRAAVALFAGAGRVLPSGAPLVLYGPFREGDRATAPSNEAFDESLKSRNPEWGLRHLDEVAELAAANGLRRVERIEMPANNLSVVFRRD